MKKTLEQLKTEVNELAAAFYTLPNGARRTKLWRKWVKLSREIDNMQQAQKGAPT